MSILAGPMGHTVVGSLARSDGYPVSSKAGYVQHKNAQNKEVSKSVISNTKDCRKTRKTDLVLKPSNNRRKYIKIPKIKVQGKDRALSLPLQDSRESKEESEDISCYPDSRESNEDIQDSRESKEESQDTNGYPDSRESNEDIHDSRGSHIEGEETGGHAADSRESKKEDEVSSGPPHEDVDTRGNLQLSISYGTEDVTSAAIQSNSRIVVNEQPGEGNITAFYGDKKTQRRLCRIPLYVLQKSAPNCHYVQVEILDY
jgi:hypothetical protein